MAQHDIAEPIASGVLPVAKQSLHDLFRWRQRVEVENEYGEKHTEWQKPEPLQNPISLMAQLGARDWLFFIVGFTAWTADAFDFHALSIQTVKLSEYFDTSKTKITEAITLTLLLRSVGAAFFGLAGDKFGRKWPMVLNILSWASYRSQPSIAIPSANFWLCAHSLVSSWAESMEMQYPWRLSTALSKPVV